MKKTKNPFLFSGFRGKVAKRSNAAAMKRLQQAKRKAAKKSKGCEFC